MFTRGEAEALIGTTVVDASSDRIGEVRQVFVDEETESPAWVGVRVGLFGADVLVPLEGADWDDAALRAACSRSSARTAPPVDLDEPLTVAEHEALCRHYGIPSVRSPREDLDPALFEDGTVSYSVKDDAMVDDDRRAESADETPLERQRDLGRAMESAAEERREGVSGHMLAPAPAPLDASTT